VENSVKWTMNFGAHNQRARLLAARILSLNTMYDNLLR